MYADRTGIGYYEKGKLYKDSTKEEEITNLSK
jgi:hypothetical protein